MTELARSRWQRISTICCSSVVAPEDRRQLVLPRQQVQVDGELLQERRQLVALAQLLVAQLDVADDGGQPRR